MKTRLFLFLSLGLVLAVNGYAAPLDFMGYLKRNHQVLSGQQKPVEKVAFKEKKRTVASTLEETESTEASATSSSSSSESGNYSSSEPSTESSSSAFEGPNR